MVSVSLVEECEERAVTLQGVRGSGVEKMYEGNIG